MIRGKTKECPFGLPITEACISIGAIRDNGSKVINDLTQIAAANSKEDKEQIVSDNMDVLLSIKERHKCPYADRTYEEKGSVDCKFDENHDKLPAGSAGLTGSPLYPHIMIGNMPEAQYGEPLDQYSDNNESRNVYYGICSLIG